MLSSPAPLASLTSSGGTLDPPLVRYARGGEIPRSENRYGCHHQKSAAALPFLFPDDRRRGEGAIGVSGYGARSGYPRRERRAAPGSALVFSRRALALRGVGRTRLAGGGWNAGGS